LSPENLADLAGEIGNTLSGNARKSFGSSFMISVPLVVEGRQQVISLPMSGLNLQLPIALSGIIFIACGNELTWSISRKTFPNWSGKRGLALRG